MRTIVCLHALHVRMENIKMGKIFEVAQDIEDLYNQGYVVSMIAKIVGVSNFFVQEVIDNINCDNPQEEDYPWQN